jgi:hypothetical protein
MLLGKQVPNEKGVRNFEGSAAELLQDNFATENRKAIDSFACLLSRRSNPGRCVGNRLGGWRLGESKAGASIWKATGHGGVCPAPSQKTVRVGRQRARGCSVNSLEHFLFENGLNEAEAMKLLQKFGVISDNAITPADVWREDQERAIEFLKGGAK